MNYKYYVAVKQKGIAVDIIRIPSNIEPTAKTYPAYAYMWGAYKTRRKALQIAMWHNYQIDSPYPDTQHCKIVYPTTEGITA